MVGSRGQCWNHDSSAKMMVVQNLKEWLKAIALEKMMSAIKKKSFRVEIRARVQCC